MSRNPLNIPCPESGLSPPSLYPLAGKLAGEAWAAFHKKKNFSHSNPGEFHSVNNYQQIATIFYTCPDSIRVYVGSYAKFRSNHSIQFYSTSFCNFTCILIPSENTFLNWPCHALNWYHLYMWLYTQDTQDWGQKTLHIWLLFCGIRTALICTRYIK